MARCTGAACAHARAHARMHADSFLMTASHTNQPCLLCLSLYIYLSLSLSLSLSVCVCVCVCVCVRTYTYTHRREAASALPLASLLSSPPFAQKPKRGNSGSHQPCLLCPSLLSRSFPAPAGGAGFAVIGGRLKPSACVSIGINATQHRSSRDHPATHPPPTPGSCERRYRQPQFLNPKRQFLNPKP